MASETYQRVKQQFIYSKSKVSKAGRAIRKGASGDDKLEAINIIQNFRASHSYPLMLIKNHIVRQSRKVSTRVIVARRLKRLPTILDKLVRPTLDGITPNSTDVSRMQDIGGCRVIFRTRKDVYNLLKRLKRSRSVHEMIKIDDYNENPKKSGYRGIHLVYDCFKLSPEDRPWKGHKIEVQIRTSAQHAWATAVEMVDLFEDTNLKTSLIGNEDWRTFFQHLGAVLDLFDKKGVESDYPLTDDDGLAKESVKVIKTLMKELNIMQKFIGYSMAHDALGDLEHKDGYYLVLIHRLPDRYALQVNYFTEKQKLLALNEYDQHELDDSIQQSVLVSAQGHGSLRKAYPNLFADTKVISAILRRLTKDETIFVPERSINGNNTESQ